MVKYAVGEFGLSAWSFCDKGSGLVLDIVLFLALSAFTECFILFIVCVDTSQMEKLQEVFIVEDDVDFEPNFHDDLEQVLEEAHRLAPQWELMSVKCRLVMH